MPVGMWQEIELTKPIRLPLLIKVIPLKLMELVWHSLHEDSEGMKEDDDDAKESSGT